MTAIITFDRYNSSTDCYKFHNDPYKSRIDHNKPHNDPLNPVMNARNQKWVTIAYVNTVMTGIDPVMTAKIQL